jgi:hypothetical protein
MTYAIIGIRNEREFKQVFGPAPVAEATEEFKSRVAKDLEDSGDGAVHGVLELFKLQAARSHKLRSAGDEAETAEPETPHNKGRKRAGHLE